MAKVLLTVRLPEDEPSPATVRRRLGLKRGQLDSGFGVQQLDPERQLYAVMVDEDAASGLADHQDVSGPYSNPQIEPAAGAESSAPARSPDLRT